ncbi:voltage-dependent calcium channel subunit alpha-2/delta-3 [Scaptodrosophila lebanonensis]|uniref:Voltage-dependent calcium channel subunit alpha-2/delta-3 n=1 Tax=Drosophila lebanonensis TaxID=7225 RepID=A0A6J2TP73_DROLE|nr:voltage-dependent calcium channel subunit alpha-2/delta-3 [Scaptodrosophila lebanonensis]
MLGAGKMLMTHFSVISTAFLAIQPLFLLLLCFGPPSLPSSSPHGVSIMVRASAADEAVGKWAAQFGDELWELAQRMTKSQEIKEKYREYNARVEEKNGTELIQSITANVGKMLARKMDAVRCIQEKAESANKNFEFNFTQALEEVKYYSSKYSAFNGNRSEELLEGMQIYEDMYLNLTLNPDTHFYNISVDTQHSAVHVPSNVYDRSPRVLKTIAWSDQLDEVFRQNYQSDPALSWQYFGSDTGILRHYPASQWTDGRVKKLDADTYDCRKRSWYIETATCSKDIVILMDHSGSMTGFRSHVAKFTIRSILDTFSNNDFFNIYSYSASVEDIIPCFSDALVQATPENINVFNDAIANLPDPEGYANVTLAYEKAFQLLRKYYVQRRCNETSTCNQAIMLVTDGVAGNTTDVFEKYNWGNGENGTSNMNVRVFTYLLGKEVTKVREIQWMACLNRGYYSHVQTLDEVHEEVLKYVDVIATPLVLQEEQHPPTWTHAFTDKTYDPKNSTERRPRLMIAVGVPAFDDSYKNSTMRRARLLGVAGTDVPVEDIDKLTLPYKLGVNGYSFVVSNNGYVLLHPDLRPIGSNGKMNPNYNSIDFTEVEHLFEDNSPREPGESILQLRSAMVRHKSGEFKDIPVKFHFDNMRRVSEEKQDYFFAPLPNTPFSLGIVLPSKYGKTWIKVSEEVKKNTYMNVSISDFFKGENWKVHPDWVYCKYHYLEGHEFRTPEAELREFLGKMVKPDWKWAEQYAEDENNESSDLNCGRKTLGDDAYYCNQELVHLLVFDAKVTNSSYGEWKFENEEEKALIESFGATLRFVATMSGLTRWQFIYGEVEVDNDQEFGDYHTTSIDETWYKSAILQHHQERDSFVYSVKHYNDPAQDAELKVTASHAIFPRDGVKEAPACVVGFQFSHARMMERFFNITAVDNCHGCLPTCMDDDIDCYVIDTNAYIVVGQNINSTGKFFGEYHGDVMAAMVEKNIYQSIDVYDYQQQCRLDLDLSSDGHILLHPIRLLSLAWKWLVAQLFWQYQKFQWWVDGAPFLDYLDDIEDEYVAVGPNGPAAAKPKEESDEGDAKFQEPEPEPIYKPCDMRSTLYALQPKALDKINDVIEMPSTRPFLVKKITNSNLVLIVVNVLMPSRVVHLTTEPQRIEDYELDFPCYKLNMSFYERRRIEECFTEHPDEELFTYCGKSSRLSLALQLLPLTLILMFFWTRHFLRF